RSHRGAVVSADRRTRAVRRRLLEKRPVRRLPRWSGTALPPARGVWTRASCLLRSGKPDEYPTRVSEIMLVREITCQRREAEKALDGRARCPPISSGNWCFGRPPRYSPRPGSKQLE